MKLSKKQVKKYLKKYSKKISKKLRGHKKSHINYSVVLAVVIIIVALAGYAYLSKSSHAVTERLVTFHDRGQNHVILTNAKSVDEALEDANIAINPGDVVEPAIGSELYSSDSVVIVYRARPVLIIDGALRQKVVTAAASPNEILTTASMEPLQPEDKASITKGDVIADGASEIAVIERKTPVQVKPVFAPGPNALTASKGAQLFTDSNGVAHRETYYDLPMNIVIGHCSDSDYTVRYDGAKIDKDGYVLVAASYPNYPKCSVVETSMGPGKVYDTGGFALRYPHGFDLATDWTNNNGR